jgi:hypothetical protein
MFLSALGLACAASGAAAPSLRPPASASPEGEPRAAFVLRPAPGRGLIVLRHTERTPPTVEYEASCARCGVPTRSGAVSAERWQDFWVADLKDLPPDGRVEYRVRSERGISAPASFKSGAPSGERFRFAAYGNTFGDEAIHRQIARAIRAEQVDFVIHTGNAVEAAASERQWSDFFRVGQPLLSSVPVFPALGSRDGASAEAFERWFITTLWNDTLSFYLQDWGSLRVVTATAGVACADGCLEAAFVRRALAEGARQGRLLMLVSAVPPYSSASSGERMQQREAVAHLAREYGVEIVLSGGEPEYERSKPIDGTTYIVSGSAGAPRRALRSRTSSEVLRVEPSYVVFDVSPDRIALRAVGVSGNVIDFAVVAAVAPQPAPFRARHSARPQMAIASTGHTPVLEGLGPWP